MAISGVAVLLLDGPEALAAFGVILAGYQLLVLLSLVALAIMLLRIFTRSETPHARNRRIAFGVALYAVSILCLFVPPFFVMTRGFVPGNWFTGAAAIASLLGCGISVIGKGPGRILVAMTTGIVFALASCLLFL